MHAQEAGHAVSYAFTQCINKDNMNGTTNTLYKERHSTTIRHLGRIQMLLLYNFNRCFYIRVVKKKVEIERKWQSSLNVFLDGGGAIKHGLHLVTLICHTHW